MRFACILMQIEAIEELCIDSDERITIEKAVVAAELE